MKSEPVPSSRYSIGKLYNGGPIWRKAEIIETGNWKLGFRLTLELFIEKRKLKHLELNT